MRINPTLANQMYLNYMSSSDSDSDSDTTTSILPSGTYSNLAAAKYIKDNDKDNDGALTSDEVTLSAEAFAALDKDSDGTVTLSEMKTSLSGQDDAIYSYYKNGGASSGTEDIVDSLLDSTTTSNATVNTYVKMAAKSYISAYDKDGDGELSTSEVSLASNAFKQIDTNSNGSLTLSELQNALRDEGDSIYKYYKNGGTTKLSTLTSNLLATI
jgi:Ca2+-binding EF-hand superfamily protein